jgi:hypothetical protein
MHAEKGRRKAIGKSEAVIRLAAMLAEGEQEPRNRDGVHW